MDDGWFILNGNKYQQLMFKVMSRAQNAKRMREERAKARAMEKANTKRDTAESLMADDKAKERRYTASVSEYGKDWVAQYWDQATGELTKFPPKAAEGEVPFQP